MNKLLIMNKPLFRLLIFILCLVNFSLQAQIAETSLPTGLITKPWPAKWIAPPGIPAHGYGVYHFRKKIELKKVPSGFRVHVSGDNRYKLFVNGQMVCLGPARGDVHHWNFETVDLSPYLNAGQNIIAAVVWNFGDKSPAAQITHRTGFIIQGDAAEEQFINTNESWGTYINEAYTPSNPSFGGFLVVGPGENIDGKNYPWGWHKENYDDSKWKNAEEIAPGLYGGLFEPWYEKWELAQRKIPAMEMLPQRFNTVRKVSGVTIPDGFPQKNIPLLIPAHSKVVVLLDQGVETTAYQVLNISNGKNAMIELSQAEALYEKNGQPNNRKGNRNEVAGKDFVGFTDKIISDGGNNREYTSLWWRTYRYLQLTIETKDSNLVINDISGIYTGYPFVLKSTFAATSKSDPSLSVDLKNIFDAGWRTARLCAHETYIDCPYYEQLQYTGDTRIQALISLFNTGDDRLMRNAIQQLKNSHGLEGITMSRYPTSMPQYIPPFSLWWIAMLHDYMMYRGDKEFIKEMMPVCRAIVHFFESRKDSTGLLRLIPYWNFTDWAETPGWRAGVPPGAFDSYSAMMDLQLLMAYQNAKALELFAGYNEVALDYQQKANALTSNIRKVYWDNSRKLFADTKEKNFFSQHTNTLAVLTGLIKGKEATQLMERTLKDTGLTQATIYFKYYLHRAIVEAGLGNRYLNLLGEWKKQLNIGLTTWAESPEPSRSDCHAWGASPNIEFFRIVLGIDSDAPGFSKVNIQPHLGQLTAANGSIPHPDGMIEADYQVNEKGSLRATISLPKGVSGFFKWKEKKYFIKPGKQIFNL